MHHTTSASRLPSNRQYSIETAYNQRKERIDPEILTPRLESIATTIQERKQTTSDIHMLIFLQFLEQLIVADRLPDQERVARETSSQPDPNNDIEREDPTPERIEPATIP
jgi:hypothetical protein